MEFLGNSLNRIELETTGLLIHPSNRIDVPGEMATRWFAYRSMHPVTATYLYAHLYKKHVVTFNERYVDIETASDARAFTPDDIFKSRDMTGMWNARACSDRVGCPYAVTLEFASKRAFERTFQRYPRPSQLYGQEFEMDLIDHWRALNSYSLTHCEDEPFTQAHQWSRQSQEPPQAVRDHATWLINAVKARGAPSHHLLGRLMAADVLHASWLDADFTAQEIEDAKEVASDLKS